MWTRVYLDDGSHADGDSVAFDLVVHAAAEDARVVVFAGPSGERRAVRVVRIVDLVQWTDSSMEAVCERDRRIAAVWADKEPWRA